MAVVRKGEGRWIYYGGRKLVEVVLMFASIQTVPKSPRALLLTFKVNQNMDMVDINYFNTFFLLRADFINFPDIVWCTGSTLLSRHFPVRRFNFPDTFRCTAAVRRQRPLLIRATNSTRCESHIHSELKL
jgi:hypothetical protein